ncbi:hypothetical protein BX661DRAFT_3231 [Kickxella alabastrina]|uniref:uncharacterized protein n=1 Tax=Kickxella alabastrina TaxID=61397 RepID=UPI00221F9E23|nr:uncharacterized protein BX661DRAFT_3231 [Kickxella alabastrina]KAI7834694.1 hypothetical protein BX661DRAFT_3231 [Kickxella alabastrina]
MSDNYFLEQQTEYEGGAGCKSYPVHVYKHKATEFRVVVCQVPGLLCGLSVCIPTLCSDHRGSPHTLEHLVFCGSEKYPYRGYIDLMASHNLGQPMNAATYRDMTTYKFVGLCQEGAANVLPVALDHIMHPIIHDNHFATEVRGLPCLFSELPSCPHHHACCIVLLLPHIFNIYLIHCIIAANLWQQVRIGNIVHCLHININQ